MATNIPRVRSVSIIGFVLFSSVSVLFGCHVGHVRGADMFCAPSPIPCAHPASSVHNGLAV